jgi:hypothetical protein
VSLLPAKAICLNPDTAVAASCELNKKIKKCPH